MQLTSKQVRALRALAHHLKPVVHVGALGMTSAVVEKTKDELKNHELIKVRIEGDRDEVQRIAHALADATSAVLAQRIGKVAILYRKRKKDSVIRLPNA